MIAYFLNNLSIYFSEKDEGDKKGKIATAQYVLEKNLFPEKSVTYTAVSHGSQIDEVTQQNHDQAFTSDALITSDPNVVLSLCVADCLPIVLTDSNNTFFALIHGGWRPLLQNIVPLTIKECELKYHAKIQDMLVWIGPSLRGCCNATPSADVHKNLPEWKQFVKEDQGKDHLYLQEAVKYQCEQLGIKRENIHDVERCTYHEKDTFYSYRRSQDTQDESQNKRHVCAIGMRGKNDQ